MLNVRLQHAGPWMRALLAAAVGMVLAAGAVVAVRTEITTLRYSLSSLRAQEAKLRGRVEILQVEATALRAPERIRAHTRERGLGPPEPGQIVRLPQPEVAPGGAP
ncbi:MAG: hypothetical protein J4G09_13115 [Proteobacteria bacterium]|nr:hypothetical protein [Pseudomonadota bacterium]